MTVAQHSAKVLRAFLRNNPHKLHNMVCRLSLLLQVQLNVGAPRLPAEHEQERQDTKNYGMCDVTYQNVFILHSVASCNKKLYDGILFTYYSKTLHASRAAKQRALSSYCSRSTAPTTSRRTGRGATTRKRAVSLSTVCLKVGKMCRRQCLNTLLTAR